MTAISIKWCKKLALLIEIQNFFQKFTCIIKSKEFVFLTQTSDFIVSTTTTTTTMISCFIIFWTKRTNLNDLKDLLNLNSKLATSWNYDWLNDEFDAKTNFIVIKRCSYEMRSKRNFVDVEQNKIDWKKFNFELSEIDIKIEFATRKIFDWITTSNFDSIEIELELRLIVNSSKLNDLKLIFARDLELTTNTTSDLIIDSKIDLIDIELKLKLIENSSNLNDLKDLLNLIFDCDLKTIFFVSITTCLIFVFDLKLTMTSTTTISCSIAF